MPGEERSPIVLPNGALADQRTRSKPGDSALDEVLASLWPCDCQSCGRGLGSDPPALVVDDLQVLTRASLHHGACRSPGWNDSFVIWGPGSALLTWRTVVLLLPFKAGRGVIRAAGLLLNPGLEEIWLTQDAGTWRPRLEQSFAAAGLTHPSQEMPIQIPAAGLAGYLSQTSLHADVTGRSDRYGSLAEPEIRAATAQLGGFLLIVTHAADPGQMNPDRLMKVLAAPVTLAGWAQLDPPGDHGPADAHYRCEPTPEQRLRRHGRCCGPGSRGQGQDPPLRSWPGLGVTAPALQIWITVRRPDHLAPGMAPRVCSIVRIFLLIRAPLDIRVMPTGLSGTAVVAASVGEQDLAHGPPGRSRSQVNLHPSVGHRTLVGPDALPWLADAAASAEVEPPEVAGAGDHAVPDQAAGERGCAVRAPVASQL